MDNPTKIKIIFGVPEGDVYARQFTAVAAAMPQAECLFLACSWSTGIDIRKAKYRFSNLYLKPAKFQAPKDLPPVAEFTIPGYLQYSIPDSAKKAFASLSAFIESEISRFAPDIVVYGPIDHSICYLMDKIAKTRGIPTVGIFSSYILDHFIVQSQGCGWTDYLRNFELTDNIASLNDGILTTHSVTQLRSLKGSSQTIWKKRLWIRGFERFFRVLCGGVTFDTLQSLSSLVLSKIAPAKWFPDIITLLSIDEIQAGCVLIALHQPALTSWGSSTWIDLIALALEATPEGIPIVIRPHPREVARPLPVEVATMLRSRGVRISRVGHGPSLTEIINQSISVMTLNSATGMEALLAGKLVFTLLPAFYSRPGMAHLITLSDAAKIREMIAKHKQFSPDCVEIMKFVSWLLRERVVPSCLIANTSTKGKTLANHILEIVNINVAES